MKNRIGIVGGGQLARMLVFDAKKMGFYTTVLDPTHQSPGGQVADEQIIADLNDEKAMQELSEKSDYITIEWELANAHLLDEFAKKGKIVNPSAKTLEIIKDKLRQKQFLKRHHIPIAEFMPVTTQQDIIKVAKKIGYPFLLKARFDAYDGRGNIVIKKEHEIPHGIEKLKGQLLYVEKHIPFTKEISVIIARDVKGDISSFPIGENIHKNNILHTTIVPARISKTIQKKAIFLAKKTIKSLHGTGVFCVEMFVDKKDRVLVNEIAPRVHNSGHYTIEGCLTSQFEQHIRAITELPLGETSLKSKSVVMVNILGERTGETDILGLGKALTIPGVTVHIYGKDQTKPQRKMGHITTVGKSIGEALKKATKARKMIRI